MTITSKRMIIEQAEQRATFEGDVVLRQGELLMRADRADVWSSQPLGTLESAQERGTISKVKASGHVDVIQGDRHVQADVAVYDEAKQEIELTGHLFGEENGYQVVGARGVIYLQENRSVIEGSQVTIPATAKPPTPTDKSRSGAGGTGAVVQPPRDR
jgi:lipopolysaccharide transport protein LptA